MLFNSHLFILVFLPVCLGVYLLLVQQGWRRLSFDWLVVASLFFYGWWKWTNLPLLLGSLIFNYSVGTWLSRADRGKRSQALLAFGVTANLVFLGYFKYTNFFLGTVNSLFGANWTFVHVVLPLGISFITFQKIAYLVDSYQGLTRGYGFRDFCLFVSFFPQLIAGPIVHHSELMPQFREHDKGPGWEDISVGLSLFVMGLAKKVLIADVFAGYAAPVFDAAKGAGGLGCTAAWAGVLAYTLQIYFDFSAYSDMAIGAGRLFGIRLPLNFNSPYKATNIADFWHRWHMTLSRFLRDYLYIPLGGNRKGPRRRYVNLMLTMLLGGLWHGAGWTFVAWGALHGAYLAVYHGWNAWHQPAGTVKPVPSQLGVWSGRLVTFLAVILAWVFFRAENWNSSVRLLQAMVGLQGWASAVPAYDLSRALRWIACFLPVVWWLPNSHEILARFQPALEYLKKPSASFLAPTPSWLGRVCEWRPNFWWAALCAAAMVWAMLNLLRPSEFIYWQF